jgi:hypothetical protein
MKQMEQMYSQKKFVKRLSWVANLPDSGELAKYIEEARRIDDSVRQSELATEQLREKGRRLVQEVNKLAAERWSKEEIEHAKGR